MSVRNDPRVYVRLIFDILISYDLHKPPPYFSIDQLSHLETSQNK